MDWSEGLWPAIGNTPLVKLSRLFDSGRLQVHAKLELMNPSGSAKDRPALRMMRQAWEDRKIGPGSVIIESSSGNLAISLAMICKYMGLRFISVIDPRTTENNIRILEALGAQIDYVSEPDPKTGEYLPARLDRVKQLHVAIPGSYWTNQYANPDNYMAHYHTTMREIVDQLDRVDYLFCGVSTCGTIRGCGEYARAHSPATRIVAVDSLHSTIFGGSEGKRRFPGLGAGIAPPLCKPDLIDQVIHVDDQAIVAGCRMLAHKESILAGASSGGVIAALKQVEYELPAGSVCAVILHDRGERYLDTVYSDDWVTRELGGTKP